MKLALVTATIFALLALSAAANADEGNWNRNCTWYNGTWGAIDNETGCQLKVMGTSHGAQMRLIQLQKSIEKNILFGENVIAYIEGNYSSYDTTGMESLIEELKVLKGEVASVNATANTTEAVKLFVDLKSDAMNITKEFRALVHDFMNETGASFLKAHIERQTAFEMEQFKEEIKDCVRNHNAETVRERLQDMGNQSLVLFQKVKDGDMTPEQANDALKDMLRNMTADSRRQAAMSMARKAASFSVKVRDAVQKAGEKYEERLRERLGDRLEMMGENGTMLRQRIENLDAPNGEWEGGRGDGMTGRATGGRGWK